MTDDLRRAEEWLRKQPLEGFGSGLTWGDALSQSNSTLPKLLAAYAQSECSRLASRVEELEKEVRELDAATDQLIGERDAAEDALQETHIALGGDGEWVAKMYATCPPDTGDLKLDVPELARQLKAELLAGAHAEEKE